MEEVNGLGESVARDVFYSLAVALRYLHDEAGVVHRDIKLSNILLDDEGVARLVDFSSAAAIDPSDLARGDVLSRPSGTTTFYPPELVAGGFQGEARRRRAIDVVLPRDVNCPKINFTQLFFPLQHPPCFPHCDPEYHAKPADVWAFGTALFAAIEFRMPFANNEAIAAGAFRAPTKAWSDDLADLITAVFAVDPQERLSMAQVSNHAWFHPRRRQATKEEL